MHNRNPVLVFCTDRNGLTGLHVALHTGLSAATSSGRIRAIIVYADVQRCDLDTLRKTAELTQVDCQVETIEINPSQFKHMRPLGSLMTYARLLLPDLLDAPRYIYLDTDIIVNADLGELWATDLSGFAIGATTWSTVEQSHDREFLRNRGLSPQCAYFNAGVLLVDASAWRQQRITERCLEQGQAAGKDIPTADQSLLNLVVAGEFLPIARRWNIPVAPHRRRLPDTAYHDSIVHLLSRPKPWDLFGFVNGQSACFNNALSATAADPRPAHWSELLTRRGVVQAARAARCVLRRLGAEPEA
jgi:lipopolysaccharide biosynthesis glycosyltransferase